MGKLVFKKLALLVVINAVLFSVLPRACATVAWTNPSGSADLFDWSNGQNDIGYFGDPNISGNTFVFFPNDFRVESTAGDYVELWDTMSVDIAAHQGFKITEIHISEYGDYGIFGTGFADVDGTLIIEDHDNSQFHWNHLVPDQPMPFTSGQGTWVASVSITGINTTNLTLTLENGLMAFTCPGSAAFIQKKVIGNAVAITIIPEPATIALMSIGALVLLGRKERTQKK